MITVRTPPIRRLWPLIIAAPLLGGCAGDYGYELPPAAFIYTTSADQVPARPFAPPMRFLPQDRPLYSVPASPPPSGNADIVLPSTPAPTSDGGNRAPSAPPPPPVADKPPAPPPPEQHKPPPDMQADSARHSPTCGNWRLGCGILWP